MSFLLISQGNPLKSRKINAQYVHTGCKNHFLPKYSGSVRIAKIYGDRALLATGNTIVF